MKRYVMSLTITAQADERPRDETIAEVVENALMQIVDDVCAIVDYVDVDLDSTEVNLFDANIW